MQTTIPTTSTILTALLKADLKTQWRNRRAVVLTVLVPVIILYSWRGIINQVGPAFALGTCITIGLMATGLMGYSNAVARDRDKGIFQRLRVAPLPSWAIMASRLLVQLLMIIIITAVVLLAGYFLDNITIPAAGYFLAFLASIAGAAVYLAIGQVIVGLIKNPETVNSTTRLVYFVFIMVGMLGQLGVLGKTIKEYIIWSPYGTVQTIVAGAMNPSKWTNTTTEALLATIAYAVVLFSVGIRKFKWTNK
ncbi:ABC transporter permease [Parafilimonas sp.]|uniref:ABC transporter permease n=1 Tax=Parafilimonas sp. TaxID=1969739 RepID=UPI0039E3BD80